MTRCSTALVGLFLSCAVPCIADQVDDYMRAEMARRQIPGAALTLLQAGQSEQNRSYGLANLELGTPVSEQTVFEIGSITKQFTAACILVLVQEGKVSVDDLISKHLHKTPSQWQEVRIRHLLSHTSGIKSYTGLSGFELTKKLTQAQFIEAIGKHPLEFEPGSKWKYCNTGYNLLGYIIENVSGKSYWDFLWDRILKPAGMFFTTNRLPSLVIRGRASGYEFTKDRVRINRDYDLTDVFAAGAMVSTTGDLANWVRALAGDQILDAKSKEAMWTGVKLTDGTDSGYGFGWHIGRLGQRRYVGHGGSTSGFSASLQMFPDDKLTVILLTNTDEQVATTMARKIAEIILTGS